MVSKLFSISMLLGGLFCSSLWAAPASGELSNLIQEGARLAQKGEWDRSEICYLKAAQSSSPDFRLQAYKGLEDLYAALRMKIKAARAHQNFEKEKKFLSKLVPEAPSFYKDYTLQAGDTYGKIAHREGISLEWLRRANKDQKLFEGRTIKVPTVQDTLRIHKTKKILEWRRGDQWIKEYPVAVGKRESETPPGTFQIKTKVKDPVWYWLKLQVPAGSPKNLLGTRWLGLNKKGYGIHGTRDPKSIRSAASHGCIRMHNHDIEELFDWISLGTKVTIQ